MFDARKYLRDRRVPFITSGKETSPGWLSISCPFCKDPEMHGGFAPEGFYSCWRCGGHTIEHVIMALERCEHHEACRSAMDYETDHRYLPVLKQTLKARGPQGKLEWPPGTLPLQPQHKRYLASRGFDPDFLEAKYGLKGTGPAGSFAWRIVVPIFCNGQMVSYQGRDITGKSELRYLACKPDLELMPHKRLLYNLDAAGDVGIIVEGVFDAWRLGDGAVACIGTSITRQQVILAAEKFKKVFIMFDPEKPAQKKARKLRDQLSILGVETINILLDKGDPADLSQGEADKLKKELLK